MAMAMASCVFPSSHHSLRPRIVNRHFRSRRSVFLRVFSRVVSVVDLFFSGGVVGFRCRTNGRTVVTRAGPITNIFLFAFPVPLTLIADTIFTSIKNANKARQRLSPRGTHKMKQ